MTTLTRFDVADYLDDEEMIAEYLNVVLEENNPELLLKAIKDIARARGMNQLAKDAGCGRESLYKSLADGAKPRYDTVLKIINALGIQLVAKPISQPVS
jgi:probable addiction module antidote protein